MDTKSTATELIVKKQALVFKNGLAYFNDALFTGGALAFSQEKVVERTRYKSGVTIGEFNSRFIQYKTEHHYDGEHLEEGEYSADVYRYKGKSCTGIFYRFYQERCYEVLAVEGGLDIGESVSFFLDGGIRSLAYKDKEHQLSWGFECYENKKYENYHINIYTGAPTARSSHALSFVFNRLNQVRVVGIEGSILSLLPAFKDKIFFADFICFTDIEKLEFATDVSFRGKEINDDRIIRLCSQKKSKITTLAVRGTAITQSSLLFFLSMPNLSMLTYFSGELSLDNFQWFKQQKPHCRVMYKRKELFA